jgi:hypothetical protein
VISAVLKALPPDAVDGSLYARLTLLEDGATLAGSADDLKVFASSLTLCYPA